MWLHVDRINPVLYGYKCKEICACEQHVLCHVASSHSIVATRSGNVVMFDPEGGVDVGDVDRRADRVEVDIESTLTEEQAIALVARAPQEAKQ